MLGTLPERRPHRAVEVRLAGKVPPLKGDLARFCLAKCCSEPQNVAEKQRKAPKATAKSSSAEQLKALKATAKSSGAEHRKAPKATAEKQPQKAA